ncbi:peptidylprolyl isomerase [Arenimonas maotaiensis]|uniref:Periplasmic chaperone PpiD n=1 Tax=Arenimonas maotaiensis TaxID=1446479 RepID=A0A917CL60_9GAMM|nr:SurA N-terminal domain-containing protein [Arenimonas maotaiensis]GGF92176.1 peptidylprolyl isomerase [Arenimonas maotaiensis]
MLQKIRDKSSGWIAKLVLFLVILVMALFGLEQYLAPKVENYAAKVVSPGKLLGFGEQSVEVSVDEFRQRFDQVRQQERARQGEAFDAAAFESPQNKRRILDQLVDEAVMQLGAERAGVRISDAMVREAILSIDAFKVDGKFDAARYQLALQQQGYTTAGFEALVRRDLLTRFMVSEYIAGGLAGEAEAEALIALQEEKRDLNYVEIPLPALDPNATDAELAAWYNSHKSDYRTPETATIEYVELDGSAAAADIAVDETVLSQRYEERKAQFGTPEQRVGSHILVAVPQGASAAADAAAKAKAQTLAKQAQALPNRFAELAKASDDIATSASGGDLGPIEKGIYGDAFDKAFFALKPGQVSEPVRLPDGWHVLYYRELIAGTVKPFEDVRAEIEAAYLESERERAFNELAGKMVNAVSENATSLEPAAKAVGKTVLRSQPFTRTGGDGIAALEPVRKAAFAEEVLTERRVSDLVEIAPNQVVLLRVVEHKPEAVLPLAEVKDAVRQAFVRDRAMKAAEAQAKALLARLNKGETLAVIAASLSRPVVPALGVGRQPPVPQLAPVVKEAFRLARPVDGKPGGGGIVLTPGGGYLLMQLVAVNRPDTAQLDPALKASAARNLGQLRGDQQALEYVKRLRKDFQIKIAEDRL